MNSLAFEQFDNVETEALTTFAGGEYKDYGRCVAATEGGVIGGGLAAGLGTAGLVAAAGGPVGWGAGALIAGVTLLGAAGGGSLAFGSADACSSVPG
ncbi:Uncharacterised protein [Streptococcus criceti]|uniref:Bacteriocin class II with double-glycine leader peptide n=1 Tax=Streptococcus criceti HS-6 TaxID=873449 RepID=G5JMR4_STRCG|nr:hypothetical protein [Streptococcus criceti]EHI73957.1 hypothetical protein STRCR_0028 [Streptococcus criceti HS-6]SUN41545.1 Uncharacterised protein [Streptococcus criceti]